MATGMSNAKARRNSKTKARASRSKLGLVAKAGKRRPHNIIKDSQGNYVSGPFVARVKEQKAEPRAYIQGDVTDRVHVPVGVELRDGLARIASMKRQAKNNSDPFAFDRMATHYRHGLFEFGKEHR